MGFYTVTERCSRCKVVRRRETKDCGWHPTPDYEQETGLCSRCEEYLFPEVPAAPPVPTHIKVPIGEYQRMRCDSERIDKAIEVLERDAYFKPHEIGRDIAPRMIEWLSKFRADAEIGFKLRNFCFIHQLDGCEEEVIQRGIEATFDARKYAEPTR